MAVEFDDRGFLSSLTQALAQLRSRSEENLDELADVMQREAERRTPVKTGRLRRSFHKRRQRQATGLVIDVINEAPYAAFVEFGTSDTAPQPFMRPAQDRARSAASTVLRRT